MKTEIVQAEPNIYEAMLQVMEAVENIDKNMTIGEGKNSYAGVSDKDVKRLIGVAMRKAKLVCYPISIEPTIKIDRWTENTNYGEKTKQAIFTEVLTTYKIVHAPTKESIEIRGYGHGVDSQDKSAGKATTYALKNALLYTFLVPTGSIDDTDKQHSEILSVPHPAAKPQKTECDDKTFEAVKQAIIDGKRTIEQAKEKFILTGSQNIELLNLKQK